MIRRSSLPHRQLDYAGDVTALKCQCKIEIFTAMKIHVVSWLVTSFSVVVGYQRFRGPC
jgi:hypothetical protein